MKHKIALITGSHGFIASHLTFALEELGVDVVSLERILLRSASLQTYLKNRRFDYIFHCASYGNLYGQDDEDETLEVNIGGLYGLLQATKHMNYEAFINFSSSSILLPYQTFYSASKLAGEAIIQAFVNKYKKPVTSVRPSTVYGLGDNPAHFIPQVIQNIKLGESMKIVPDPTHDYIYIDDLISGVLYCVENIDKLRGMGVNISNDIATSNQEVINILSDVSGKKLKVGKVKNMRPYDNLNWKVDNSLLKSLGWRPQISLKEGLDLIYNLEDNYENKYE